MSSDLNARAPRRWRLLSADGAARSGALARAADTLVGRLQLPRHATWADLQAAVEATYGKPILLVASTSDALHAVTGLWIDTAEFGVVVCRNSDEPHYQAQNAFHELAHILLATAPQSWLSAELQAGPAGDGRAPSLLCASSPDHGDEHARVEAAVEEVAFAMARAIQSLRRSDEEAYFG